MSLLAHIRMKWFPDPAPPLGSYANQRVLITGGTTGLGLAAAVQLLEMGASEVIITARNTSRGQKAKEQIEKQSSSAGQGRVRVIELDMNSYLSVAGLVEQLKQIYSGVGGIDFAILNAGIANASFVMTQEGWEENIQVNTLSTTLLGVLLVQWMKDLRSQRPAPAHLVFVTSGRHLSADITKWQDYASRDGGVLSHFTSEKSWPGSAQMYDNTKLLMQYNAEEVAKLALGLDGRPTVIVNTLCPGPVGTELSRSVTESSWIMKFAVTFFSAIVAKTPDLGARLYAQAGLTTPEQHGKFLRGWATDNAYAVRSAANITSPQARVLQKLVWREVCTELISRVPAIRAALQEA